MDSAETIARFLNDKDLDKRVPKRPRKSTFKPRLNSDTQRLELSVFRLILLTDVELLIQAESMARQTGPNIAHADVKVKDAIELKLLVEADNNPKGHANIINWPIDDADRTEIAENLAQRASVVFFKL